MLCCFEYFTQVQRHKETLSKISDTFLLSVLINFISFNPIPWRVPMYKVFQNCSWICSLELSHIVGVADSYCLVNVAPAY
jgi:hypothetical protein